ncbi:MAG: tetratricopeptide repeat protein, partial [Acidobacteriota bacterium]|nr:tetratricopeptide repeat protein [Acidobacteriota bacterium]
AQSASSGDETEDDPVQLFQQGQDAHEAGDLKRAVELYEHAIKLRPEFPEAEYQRASALQSLNRLPEAEKGFRRAIELQPEWPLPYTALGKLLTNLERYDEAEKLLRRALELDAKNTVALVALTDLYIRAKAPGEKLQALLADLRSATERDRASAAAWRARSRVEFVLDQKTDATVSLDRALQLDKHDVESLMTRAQLRASAGNYEGAIQDAIEASRISNSYPADHPSLRAKLLLARIYVQAGKADEAVKTLDSLDEASKRLPEVTALRNSLQKDCSNSTAEDRAVTEALLKKEPRNATLLSCLGASLRTVDPARSLELYRQAAEVEPSNTRYATGYAAALIQARRFGEAVVLLRRILAVEPNNFVAHSNLATALYELKQFPDAINEFKWLLATKPDLAVGYYFIATAYDFLGEYREALAAYESFLAKADAQTNQLEIDKVNLRLPSLRNQVKRGEGAKKRK